MFIRSTGLGRTLLTARVANIETTQVVPSTLDPPKDGAAEPMRMLMIMQVVHPVNWTVRAFVDPSDLRHMIKVVLTHPMLILGGSGSSSPRTRCTLRLRQPSRSRRLRRVTAQKPRLPLSRRRRQAPFRPLPRDAGQGPSPR